VTLLVPAIDSLIEALLFVADGPVQLDDLARALEESAPAVEAALDRLALACAQRGLRVVRQGTHVQMTSAPEAAATVERFLGLSEPARLSAAALETLAIVAYMQPVTRAQIEAIRGVNSDAVLRTLVAKELLCQVGRLEQAGRPLLYGTTFDFLEYFGITSLAQLPVPPELHDLKARVPDHQQQ
jgi:segregation and condensation protein B